MNVWEKAYDLNIGESIKNYPNNNSSETLTKVPGGWIYIYGDMQGTTSCFVPYNTQTTIKEYYNPE